MHTTVVRQYESVTIYVALVTPTVCAILGMLYQYLNNGSYCKYIQMFRPLRAIPK